MDAQTVANGTINPISCLEEDCVDGVVLRGNFSEFSVPDDVCSNTSASWNALASEIESVIEECANGTRQVGLSDIACCVYQQFRLVLDFLPSIHSPQLHTLVRNVGCC